MTQDPSQTDELEATLKTELAPELEIVRRLGRGSMASVFLAREQQLKRLVAVKVLSPRMARDERARQRFEREAQTAAALSHPNIVPVFRVGRLSNGLPYMVMLYVKGRTMAERLQAEGPLKPDEARRALLDVARALAAAHRKGFVHRDVRPGNVFYEEDSGRSLLGDFGIAAILASGESSAGPRLTKTGELVGDPAHMSPEQLLGQNVTEQSDVYALGLLGYELLSGRGPYEARSKRELITAHIQAEPKKISELGVACHSELEELLFRCLAKEPGHRPRASDIARRLESPGESTPVPDRGPAAPGGLLSSLTERHLPQIVLAYAAIAWGLLQLTDQLVQQAILPEVGYRLALVALATGLPAVTIGAWFHGKKGQQKFTRVEYWLFGALAVIWLAVSALILISWSGS